MSKTSREVELEELLKTNLDKDTKKKYQKEINQLISERREEQDRLELEAEHARAIKEDRISSKRSKSGSRIHIKYDRRIESKDLEIEKVLKNLEDFAQLQSDIEVIASDKPTALKKGMKWEEANMILGMPIEASTLENNGMTIITCKYVKEDYCSQICRGNSGQLFNRIKMIDLFFEAIFSYECPEFIP